MSESSTTVGIHGRLPDSLFTHPSGLFDRACGLRKHLGAAGEAHLTGKVEVLQMHAFKLKKLLDDVLGQGGWAIGAPEGRDRGASLSARKVDVEALLEVLSAVSPVAAAA